MTPDTVPAFLSGDFKEIGHRDKSISVGHQSEFVRSMSQDILNETRQLLGFFDAHRFSHAVRRCPPRNLSACLTRMPRFDKFLKLCEIFNLKQPEARLPHATRLATPSGVSNLFLNGGFWALCQGLWGDGSPQLAAAVSALSNFFACADLHLKRCHHRIRGMIP